MTCTLHIVTCTKFATSHIKTNHEGNKHSVALFCSAFFHAICDNYKYTNTAWLKRGYTIQKKNDIGTPVGEPVWPSGKALG